MSSGTRIHPEQSLHVGGPNVLVLDADPGVRRLLRRELSAAGFHVQEEEPNTSSLFGISLQKIDLLILDLDSPEGGGMDAIRIVRDISGVPILTLSVRGDEESMVEALLLGADDYIQKPFRLKELLARSMNALRRRAQEQGKPVLIVGDDVVIDLLRRRVQRRGQVVHLALKSYDVLRVLAEDTGKVLTHGQIMAAVWGTRRVARVEYLRIAIQDLRTKLEPDPARPIYILTERGIGYRLNMQIRQSITLPVMPEQVAP